MATRQMFRKILVSARNPGMLSNTTSRCCSKITSGPRQANIIPQGAMVQRVSGFHTGQRLLNQNIITIQDEEDFKKRVLDNATPVIVDFHATWCGPCKMLGPRLESLISSRNGKVIMAKVDIDENADLAIDQNVEAVPTVLAVKAGKIVDRFVGLKDDVALEKFVDSAIGE